MMGNGPHGDAAPLEQANTRPRAKLETGDPINTCTRKAACFVWTETVRNGMTM